MKKRSPFRQTSSNQEGFGIQRNAKLKPVRKKTKKKSVTKKQGETDSIKTINKSKYTLLSDLSDQELVPYLASMPVVSPDDLNYLTTSGRLNNLFTTQFDNDDPVFGEQLQSAYNKYGSMVNQMDGGYKYQGEIVDASELQAFHPMFRGGNEGVTDYVAQTFGTGPDMFPYRGGFGGGRIKSGSGYGPQFPGAPDASMYTGDQKGYIEALNEFRTETAKEFQDMFTGGIDPIGISTTSLGQIPGTGKYLQAIEDLNFYVNSEIELINQANQNVGNSGKNKRTKRNKRNKNRLFK